MKGCIFADPVRKLLTRLRREDSGAIAVVAAVVLPVVIGGMGLGTEVGYWFFNQRKVQNAADMAAYAAAVELRVANNSAMTAAALEAAEETGYVAGRGTLVTNYPPTTGTFAGDLSAVEIELREDLPRMFSAIFADGDVPVLGRSVAQISNGTQTCVLALDPEESGAITFIGSSETLLIGCSVHANSLADDAVSVSGSAAVETPCVSTSGEVDATAGLLLTTCVAPYEHAEGVPDPYSDLPVPDTTEPCEADNNFGGGAGSTYTISPGRYCDGLTISRNVTMEPGIYVIDDGEFDLGSQANVVGDGVMIYLTNGAELQMNGGAEVDLRAADSGDYSGVLFYIDRDDDTDGHKINGNSSSHLNGAIYGKSAHIEVLGGSDAASDCTQVVTSTVKFSGNSQVGINCTGSGVREIPTSRLVSIVE